MNLTHVVHEFSFGPYFPAISQPLDMSIESTPNRMSSIRSRADHVAFTIFQYFLRVVPTTYIDASRRKLITSQVIDLAKSIADHQYAVTDYSRSFEHGQGVPGIFFKFDLEGMALTIRERTTSLYQFLIRLVGVVGGSSSLARHNGQG